MFTKFYDFSFFSFFHYIFYFILLLSTFPRRLVSGVVGGQIRGLSGGEQPSSCILAKVYNDLDRTLWVF